MGQIIAFFDFDNFSQLLQNGAAVGFDNDDNQGLFYFFTCYENEYGGSWIPNHGNHGNCHDDCTFCHLCRSAKIILAPDIGGGWLYAPNQPFKFLRHKKTPPQRYAHLLNSPNLKGYEFSPEEAQDGNPYFHLAKEIEGVPDCGSTWNQIKGFDAFNEVAIKLLEEFAHNMQFGGDDDFRTRVMKCSSNIAPEFRELINWNGGVLREFLDQARAENRGLEVADLRDFIQEKIVRIS